MTRLKALEQRAGRGLSLRSRCSPTIRQRRRALLAFEGWADEGLMLPVQGTTVGAAWRPVDGASGRREPAFRFLDTPDAAFDGEANLHRRLRMRPGLSWVLGAPVTLGVPAPAGSRPALLDAVFVHDGITRLPADEALRAAFVGMLDLLSAEEIGPAFALPEEP